MKIFCYFVEPASYTVDLASNVYEKLNIDYCFLKSNSLAYTEIKKEKVFFNEKNFFNKIFYIYKIYFNNDFIIVNGYNNLPFVLSYIFHFFSFNKKYIAIDSDTQYSIPNNIFKRFIKWIYLSLVFRTKNIFGFAGGSKKHKDLFREYGMKEENIFLIPMVVNNKKFYCINKIFPDKFVFLYVGRLEPHKGVEKIIEEFNSAFFEKNAILKIIGDGSQKEYLKGKFKSKQVCFLGPLFDKDLIDQFHDSSCFLCPSDFEPWGLVVNEALSSSLPVIATKEVGSAFDLIKNNNNGFIVKDMDEFRRKMLKLYNDPNLLFKYSNNACKFMKEYWNYDLYINNLNLVINKINK